MMIFIRRIRQNPSRLKGERSSSLDLARGRMAIISGFFILVYVLMGLRVVDLSVIQGVVFSSQDEGRVEVSGPASSSVARGDILDRNGVLLATTLETSSLFADTALIAEPEKAAKGLNQIFPGLAYGDVLQKLQSGRSFVWIKRNITPEEKKRVLEIGEPGLGFEASHERFYPQEGLTAHLVGYTNVDNTGMAGVERSFNSYLSDGKPLRLSLDIRLQHALKREVAAAMNEFSGIGAAGIVMDVTNGELLAGVSLPDFNPHHIGAAKDEQKFNRLTLGAYELGSVFKIFSTAAFFENRDMPMSTKFDVSEPIKAGRFRIRDYHPENRELTIPEVFMHSSNIGTAMMAQAIGTDALKSFYADLGLLDPLNFEIREVTPPILPHPWREVSTLTASYGHGIAVTPVQMVAAVSSVVNGGFLVKPKLALSDKGVNKKTDIQVVSEKTSHRMRQLLRIVVSEGTGSKANVPGYKVGGKTGTAEKIVNGKYDNKKKISSFVGVFPVDNPKYAVFIMVDEPKGIKRTWGYATGGWVAAPAVARVVASMAAILGMPPQIEPQDREFGYGLKQYISAKEKG